MNIVCPVSLGELVDKISILQIKMKFIQNSSKKESAATEERELNQKLQELNLDGVGEFLNRLVKVNTKLWKIEDDIREKERESVFDKEFIELARSVYKTNDQRFNIKNEINTKFGSSIKEVKSYQSY